MAMKIRNRFLVSLLMLTFALLAASALVSIRGMRRLEKETLSLAVASVNSITIKNIELSQDVLTRAGERFVEMNSSTAAIQLCYILSNLKKPVNYSYLRSSKEIREIATSEIRGFGKKAKIAGRMDLLDMNGEAVIHVNPSVEGKNYRDWAGKFPEMWRLVKLSFTTSHVSGYYTFIDANNRPVRKFMSLSRVEGTPFIVCAVVEIKDFFSPVHKIIKNIDQDEKKHANADLKSASKLIMRDLFRSGAIAAGGLFLLGLLMALWQSETLAAPIRRLAKQAESIGDGDFSARVAEAGASETRLLARSFNNLGAELAEYVDNLKKETAAREAIESEIKVARGIQEALIPRVFPPFPDIREFELHASLTPANEVSGDFYDYFMIDDDTLVLVVADVSGKGLPAAIFMAVTRTLIRNLCMNNDSAASPSEIMRKANQYLCIDNDACMFVTTFIACYKFKTGEITYANAGHNPFIAIKNDNTIESKGVLSDFPLGIVAEHDFSEGKTTLTEGEAMLIYTDGITEATAPDGAMFGEKRLLSFLAANAGASPSSAIESLVAEVLNFQNEERFDDITVLMVRRDG